MILLLVVGFLGLFCKSILLCKVFVGMLDFVVRLWILFYHWGEYAIFRRELCLKVGRFYQKGGVWNVRLAGCHGLDGYLRIMKY
jgi:hypothetical protein